MEKILTECLELSNVTNIHKDRGMLRYRVSADDQSTIMLVASPILLLACSKDVQ